MKDTQKGKKELSKLVRTYFGANFQLKNMFNWKSLGSYSLTNEQTYSELTSDDGSKGYVFGFGRYAEETIDSHNNIKQLPMQIKFVDYQKDLAGYCWSK